MAHGMKPDDIIIIPGHHNNGFGNSTAVCMKVARVSSGGVFFGDNPLHFSLPLLLLQLSLTSASILLAHYLLKPLRLPLVVAQVLGGIILGPSLMCRSHAIAAAIFPLRGFMLLDVLSALGFMYYFFLIGVQTDLWMMKKIDRKTFAIGFFTVVVAMMLSTAWAFFMIRHASTDDQSIPGMLAVAQSESALSFPMVAYFLNELKISNSEFGRLAMCSSMVSNLCSFCVITTTILLHESPSSVYGAIQMTLYSIGLMSIIFIICRPLLLWLMKQYSAGQPWKQSHVVMVLLAVAISGFCSEALGLHLHFGPLVLGLMVPAGPPIGSAIVEKLEFVTHWIMMPLFFGKTGLEISIFDVGLKRYFLVQFIAITAVIGKLLGAFLTALCSEIPLRDAFSLGLVMNAQGILEIGLFKMMRKNLVIDDDDFTVMCVSLVIVTGTIAPIVRYLNDPSRRYTVYNKRTVMHSRPNSELRLLVCIHDQENVPSSLNLIEALDPCKQSPLALYVLHLIELVGRATPILIPHKMTKKSSGKVSSSEHIINAFRYLEQSHNGLVTVFPFTAISPTKTMHDDTCTMALDKKVSLVIVPFHKRFLANGATQSHKPAIKITNKKILSRAPCSVAILVDRGPLKSSRPIWATWSLYNVAIIFLGGPDDREAVAIGARMSGLPNVRLTVIRLLCNGNVIGDDMENVLDNELLSDFRKNIAGNCQAMYIEEVVMDGTGTVAVLRSMEDKYELVVVGRRHDNQSPLLSGLAEWNENRELGTIGDVLASASFLGNTTILVVQQHSNGEGELKQVESFKSSVVDDETSERPLHRKTPQSCESEYHT